MTPPRKKPNGPTWEDVHNELKVLVTKDELNKIGDRLGGQIMSLDLRLNAFTQQVSENTRQTATLMAQLAVESKSLRVSMDDQATKVEVLRTDLTDFELDSARGDKRVGIIGAALAFIGSVIATALGTNR